MANGIRDEIVSTLSSDLGGGSNFNKSNIQYQEKVRAYDSGLDSVVDAIDHTVRVERAEEKKEQRKRELSDKLTGELKARKGEDVPVDASEATRTSYRATRHMLNTDAMMKKATAVFETEDFQELSEAKQEEKKQQIVKLLGDTLATAKLEDNVGSQEYIINQMKAVDVAYSTARNNYRNMILPQRTIGNMTDMLIKGGANEQMWADNLKLMKSKNVTGEMPSIEVTKVLYGEFTRAIESGNLDAYKALKNSDTWQDLSSSQKLQFDQSYEREVTSLNKNTIETIAKEYRGLISQTLADGDITRLNEITTGLQKLPSYLSEPIYEKIRSSMDKVQPTRIAINKLWMRESGVHDSDLTNDQAEVAYDYMTREAMNDGGGEISAQEAGQMAALRGASNGIFHEKSTNAFDLTSPSFVDGVMDSRSRKSIMGANKLFTSAISQRDMQRIMGDKNYDIYMQTRDFMDQNLPVDIALSRAIENNTIYEKSSVFEKGNKALKDLTEINQSGIIENVLDGIADVFGTVVRMPKGTSQFEAEQSRELELSTFAPIGGDSGSLGDGLTSASVNAIGLHNQGKATLGYLDFQKRFPAQSAKLQGENYRKFLEEDAIIANSNLIVNERLGDRLKSVAGGVNMRRANEMLSLTMQALTPMMVLPRQDQLAIQDTMTKVFTRNDKGDFDLVTDNQQRRMLLNQQRSRPSDDVKISLDRKVYEKLYDKGGTLRNGAKIPPIRSAITELAGAWDTRQFGREFILHTLDYDENTRTFIASGLDRSGEALTTDKPILDRQIVDGKEIITTELEADSPIVGAFSEDLVVEFMRTYALEED